MQTRERYDPWMHKGPALSSVHINSEINPEADACGGVLRLGVSLMGATFPYNTIGSLVVVAPTLLFTLAVPVGG